MKLLRRFARLGAVTLGVLCFACLAVASFGQVEDAKPEEMRSFGVFVTLARLSQVTEAGVDAIPMGSLVSVVEAAGGQKYAVFKNVKIPIHDLSRLSNDPAAVAKAATTTITPQNAGAGTRALGTAMSSTQVAQPEATSSEQIRVDDAGNVISRSKTTTISDGAGNTTVITQGRAGGMSPEQAGRLAAAQQRISQQRDAITALKSRKSAGGIISGYEAKLKELSDLLIRMEVEYARMRTEYGG